MTRGWKSDYKAENKAFFDAFATFTQPFMSLKPGFPLNIFFCLLVGGNVCESQNARIDSLKKVADAAKDTNAVNSLNLLSISGWQTGGYKQALQLAEKAKKLAEALKFEKGVAIAMDNLGTTNWYLGNYPEALKNHLASLSIKEKQNDKGGIAVCYNNIAIVYLYQENFPEALKQYNAALKIFEEKCGEGTGNKDKRCLKGIAATYNNIGNTYYYAGKPQEAVRWFLRSLKIREEIGDKQDIAASYNNLANLYEENGNYEEAVRNYNAALKLMEEMGDKDAIAGFYINMGSFFTRVKKYKDADLYLNKALGMAKDIGSLIEMKECYSDLAILDSARGNYKGALDWYKLFITTRDSLVNEENTKKTVRLEMTHEFEKKENEARLEQEKKDALAAAEKRKQRIILLAISGFGLLVLGFAIFAYRSFLQKKKANQEISMQKYLIEEKQKEILDSIHYAKRIQTALIPSEWYIAKQLKRMTENG